eukprot:scpid46694/ scgid18381/ Dopamine beta-hydroxylase; Dopamine beta-monooxygenase; Soluble dopamine beta-hydroxylase
MTMALKVLLILSVVAVTQVLGFAHYRLNIPNGFSVQHPCDSSKIWHGVGHQSDQGGDARNQFGLDFKQAGYMWSKALCQNDSDGDGVTNGEELGDPHCVWTPGQPASRTVNITHPGFKTPVATYPFSSQASSMVDCSRFFKRCKAFDVPGVKYIDLRARNNSRDTVVPAKVTTYYNMMFELPADRQYHAVGFAPILDNLNVIHHFLVRACDHPHPTDKGFESFAFHDDCQKTMYAWSFGMGDECFPEEAGVPFGGKHPRYVQVQLHWTNPEEVADYRDRSGVRMYYTTKLRKYDLGTMSVGQLDLTIPPHQQKIEAPFACSAACTNTLLDQGPVKLINNFPHMHFLGKSMFVDLVKRDGQRTRIMDDKSYNYNSPVTFDYSPDYIDFEAGDKLAGSCTFTSMSRNDTTYWGYGSYDEMCFGFMRYYPSRGGLSCYQYDTKDLCYEKSFVEGPRCSLFDYFENITTTVNTALHGCSDVMDVVTQRMERRNQSEPGDSTRMPLGDRFASTAATHARPVCTSRCLSQMSRIVSAHRDPCQKTRHKPEWKELNRLVSHRVSTLDDVVSHCQTAGVVNQEEKEQEVNSGSTSLLGNIALMATLALVATFPLTVIA